MEHRPNCWMHRNRLSDLQKVIQIEAMNRLKFKFEDIHGLKGVSS